MTASLDLWRKSANALFAAGKESVSLAILASLASPLMRYSTQGAAIVCLIGSGAPNALRAATSIWYSTTEIDVDHTVNIDGLAVCPDLGNRDPEITLQFIQAVTASRSLLLAGSAKSVTDIMPSVDARSRIIELHVPYLAAPSQMEANNGLAGEDFMGYVGQAEVQAYLAAAVPQWSNELWQAAGERHEHRYWATTFGVICVAASIAHKLNLIAFSPGRIAKLCRDYMAGTSMTAKIPSIAADALQAFIIKYASDDSVVRLTRQGKFIIRRPEFNRFLILRKLDTTLVREELLRLQYVLRWNDQNKFGKDRTIDAAIINIDHPNLTDAREAFKIARRGSRQPHPEPSDDPQPSTAATQTQ